MPYINIDLRRCILVFALLIQPLSVVANDKFFQTWVTDTHGATKRTHTGSVVTVAKEDGTSFERVSASESLSNRGPVVVTPLNDPETPHRATVTVSDNKVHNVLLLDEYLASQPNTEQITQMMESAPIVLVNMPAVNIANDKISAKAPLFQVQSTSNRNEELVITLRPVGCVNCSCAHCPNDSNVIDVYCAGCPCCNEQGCTATNKCTSCGCTACLSDSGEQPETGTEKEAVTEVKQEGKPTSETAEVLKDQATAQEETEEDGEKTVSSTVCAGCSCCQKQCAANSTGTGIIQLSEDNSRVVSIHINTDTEVTSVNLSDTPFPEADTTTPPDTLSAIVAFLASLTIGKASKSMSQ